MYVKVRLRLNSGALLDMKVDLPELRDYHPDTIDDAVSDHLDKEKVNYKWYRVILPKHLKKKK